MADQPNFLPMRFIIFHIHPVSAKLCFLLSQEKSLCLPEPLPKLSDICEDSTRANPILEFPKQYLSRCSEKTHLPIQFLDLEANFRMWIDTPTRVIPLYALRFTQRTPLSVFGGSKWIQLPDCFQLRPIEREIMQAVYKWLFE